ncbi:MAG: hypothetical protein HQM16_17585 [Deltaproteobacteria bacterium]|nr:hypothetical protein [Deltaproteobacteria bacterium]
MKKTTALFLFTLAILVSIFATARAEDTTDANANTATLPEKTRPLSLTAEFDFNSRYLWRGVYYSQGAAWQPSVFISKWGLSAGVWTTMNLTNELYRGRFSEIDPTLSYERTFFDKLTIKPSFAWYFYPNTGVPSTGELTLDCSYALGDFYIAALQAVDIRQYKGGYFGSLGAGYTKDLSDTFSFDGFISTAFATAKWNNGYYGVSTGGSDYVSAAVSLTARPWSWFYVKPHLQYVILTTKALRDSQADPNPFVVGVAIGAEY